MKIKILLGLLVGVLALIVACSENIQKDESSLTKNESKNKKSSEKAIDSKKEETKYLPEDTALLNMDCASFIADEFQNKLFDDPFGSKLSEEFLLNHTGFVFTRTKKIEENEEINSSIAFEKFSFKENYVEALIYDEEMSSESKNTPNIVALDLSLEGLRLKDSLYIGIAKSKFLNYCINPKNLSESEWKEYSPGSEKDSLLVLKLEYKIRDCISTNLISWTDGMTDYEIHFRDNKLSRLSMKRY